MKRNREENSDQQSHNRRDDDFQNQNEENIQTEDEGGEEYNENEESETRRETAENSEDFGEEKDFDIKAIAQKVLHYLEENYKEVDKSPWGKYIPLALLALYGLRKSNFLGNMIMLGITAFLTNYLDSLMKEANEKETAVE